ncbi:MAG TPA: apolipoprotein N-acyltransferase [Patescibacteria group bacterium]|nr:apolipoprotein N-acyltransferase [Patescibacteria group bacterium]
MNCTACTASLEGLSGFRRYAAAFLLGALSVLALAPVGLFPVLFFTIPAFATLARFAPTRGKGFAVGWAFGAGYFIFSLYWVSAALFVDIEQWRWVLPLSLIVGPAILGLYFGFIPLLARCFRDKETPHALAFAAAWGAVEFARGHLLTGFPWNLAGETWVHVLPVLQVCSVTGIYGLTLLTVFWALIPHYRAHPTLRHIAIMSLVVAVAAGAIRLSIHPTEYAGDTRVRIVQGNIPQETKWNKDDDWRHFEKHLNLTATQTPLAPHVVIWPETAVNADLYQFPEIAKLISMKLPGQSVGLLGSLRVDGRDPNHPYFYNSLTAVDKTARVAANYDKHHLVPFGEFIPFRQHMSFKPLAMAVSGIGDFTRGPGPQTLHVPGVPGFSPLICYEVIFPGEVADRANRPHWLVNVTNDGWYGNTAGPRQHFAIARLRAIEEGLPLARAANTGISAMIDPLGRVLGSAPLGTEGYVDARLPAPLPPTPFSQAGSLAFFALLAGLWAAARHMRRATPD